MKQFLFMLAFLAMGAAASAQKLWFVYLQSEQEQPFFVKMDDKIYSASATGYLILPRLKDSTYTFSVGFPQGKWPEQRFTIHIANRDKGYLLKNLGDKGWGLLDLQTMNVQMPAKAAAAPVLTERTEVSPFTEILSKAADDSTLRYRQVAPSKEKPVAKAPEKPAVPPTEAPAEPLKNDPPVAAVTPVTEKRTEEPPVVTQETLPVATVPARPVETAAPVVKDNPVAEYRRSVITRRSQTQADEGLSIVYEEETPDGSKDLITILIPEPPSLFRRTEEKKDEQQTKPVKPESAAAAAKPRNTCKKTATENDFLKLRRKMAAELSDDGMIAEAKKYFKGACFTTQQIKNLSSLFLSNAGKYNFYDASYPYVSDEENFATLEGELKDNYYINRFRAMLR